MIFCKLSVSFRDFQMCLHKINIYTFEEDRHRPLQRKSKNFYNITMKEVFQTLIFQVDDFSFKWQQPELTFPDKVILFFEE